MITTPDSRKEVLELEAKLAKAAQAENIASLPTIRDFIEYMTFQKEAVDHQLTEDRTLTDRDRDRLFEKKALMNRFISLFNGDERKAVEQNIKDLLDVAKSH